MTAITYYYQYESNNPAINRFIERVNALRYRYYASELLDRLVREPDFDLEEAVRKAIVICKLTGIPVQNHFRAVYRSEYRGIARDWKLSELACGIVVASFKATTSEGQDIQDAFMDYLGL
ncbi:MAG TPA: hypothetical protein VE870_01745 [Bacteroidales bacterium]|nr:hypothetical protein [Bacteroidales bacterium]